MKGILTTTAFLALLNTGAYAQSETNGPLTIAGMCLLSEFLLEVEDLPEDRYQLNRFALSNMMEVLEALDDPNAFVSDMRDAAESWGPGFTQMQQNRMADCIEPLAGQ